TPRPRQPFHHANLHPHHAGAVEKGLREGASAGMKKPFPFWLVCALVFLSFPIVGGMGSTLFVRVLKGGRTWRELSPPSGERVVALLDATITTDKEHRLCVRTER